jgi:hypothetical protein
MDRKALNSPVTIEYDSRNRRVRKTLPDTWKARQFYAAKFKAGKKPAVVYKQQAG